MFFIQCNDIPQYRKTYFMCLILLNGFDGYLKKREKKRGTKYECVVNYAPSARNDVKDFTPLLQSNDY